MNAFCSICLEVFQNKTKDTAYTSKCGHVFHLNCITNWHEKSQTCPDCRVSFTKDEIYKLNFHCEDVSEAVIVTETKFRELQVKLDNISEELAELHLELAKKSSELQELEETCRTVIENFETLSAENDRLKKDLKSAKDLESSFAHLLKANENLESEQPGTVNTLTTN